MKKLIEHLQQGNVINNNGKQLKYNDSTMRYEVGELKTICILTALNEFRS